MPNELTFQLVEFDVLSVEFASDVGLPVFRDFREFVGEVDLFHGDPFLCGSTKASSCRARLRISPPGQKSQREFGLVSGKTMTGSCSSVCFAVGSAGRWFGGSIWCAQCVARRRREAGRSACVPRDTERRD